MSDLGKIVTTNAGDYSASTTYEALTMVRYNSATWMSLKETTGNAPSESSSYWRLIAKDGSDVTVDSEISETSENPVQNKVIAARFEAQGAAVLIQEDAPSDTSALWVW
jgi:hypothetical protein